jgi:hypothetical protein
MPLSVLAEGAADLADRRAALEAFLEARDDDPRPRLLESDGPELLVELHPAGPPLVLRSPHPGAVRLEAMTGTVGPGLHAHVLDLLPGLADALGMDGWRRVEATEEPEATAIAWARRTAAEIRDLDAKGYGGFAILLPEGARFRHDGVVATPLGPRSAAWLEAVAGGGGDPLDVFAWPHPGRDATYYERLALSQMWTEVRWRPALPEERPLLDACATWLELAFALDPSRPYPIGAWAELFLHLGEDSLRATRVRMKADAVAGAARIGYRRRPVRVDLGGGWSLEVDGELAERWDDRGTWVAYDESRSLFFNSLSAGEAPGERTPTTEDTLAHLPELEGDDPVALERGELRARAASSVVERDGHPVHRLAAHAAFGPHAAVGTFVYTAETDRDWALGVWSTLRHDDEPAG